MSTNDALPPTTSAATATSAGTAPAADAALRQREPATLGASSLFKLLDEFTKLRGLNNRQHNEFDRKLKEILGDLKASFTSFAADTQRAYQELRKEIQGEKRASLAQLNTLLEISQDLQEIVAHKPPLDDPEALRKWIEAIEIESRKVD